MRLCPSLCGQEYSDSGSHKCFAAETVALVGEGGVVCLSLSQIFRSAGVQTGIWSHYEMSVLKIKLQD